MRSATLLSLLTITVWAIGAPAPARAGDACCPAEAGGAATLAEGQAPADGGMKLPSGHPPLPGGHPALPAGHPAIDGQEAAPAQPFKATLAIKAVQGTKDGPKLADKEVTVRFMVKGQAVATQQAKLDANGVVMLQDVDLPGPCQPLVTLLHGGVPYQTVGAALSADKAEQMLKITVYESTETPPDWDIAMRHVMVDRDAKGLRVTEVLALRNPSDRTWVGQPLAKVLTTPGIQARLGTDLYKPERATVVIPLPAGAQEVQLGAALNPRFNPIDGQRLVHAMPLLPGSTKLQFSYLLPADNGQVTLALSTPAATSHLMVFLPNDGSKVETQVLAADDSMGGGQQKVRFYSAKNVATTATPKLVISGLTTADAKAEVNASATGGSAKTMVGVGAGLLAVGAVAVLFLKPARKAAVPA